MSEGIIIRRGGTSASSGFPEFTYTGDYLLLDDGNKNWRIKFLTSGILYFITNPGTVDIFLVGGGGAGQNGSGDGAGCGGGGGYTRTSRGISLLKETEYVITIGSGGLNRGNAGSDTTFDVLSCKGGYAGTNNTGGNGGSGGGGNPGGSNGNSSSGKGQIETPGPNGETGNTSEFGENGNTLYSGGGGQAIRQDINTGGEGGGGGGATAGGTNRRSALAGIANTGGGGGGGFASTFVAAGGGSGIAIIRNHREVT